MGAGNSEARDTDGWLMRPHRGDAEVAEIPLLSVSARCDTPFMAWGTGAAAFIMRANSSLLREIGGPAAMGETLHGSSKAKMVAGRLRGLIQPLVWTAGVLVVWEAAGRILEFNPDILPTPSRILLEWIRESDRLQAHGIFTAAEVLGSFFLSLVLSLPVALALALSPPLHRIMLPVLSALSRAPLIAAAPLAFIWLGFGFRSILLLACLLSFLTLTLGFVRGLRSVSDDALDLMRLARAGPVRTFLQLRLPSSLPCAFGAMKAAIPLVVSAVAVGEFVDGEKGLGYLMLAAAFKLETSLVFAALGGIMLLGLLIYGLVVLAELTCVQLPRGSAGPLPGS